MLFCLALVFSVPAFAASKTADKATPTVKTKASVTVSTAAVTKKVNINKADAAVLTTISGIGPKKAAAIVSYRKSNGRFKTIEELTQVKGIGPKILEKIKNKITI